MGASNETGAANPHHVVILGAGYAGMAATIQLAARAKRRGDVRVTLVNAQERFTERLRLPMTATGQHVAELRIPELLEGTGARFVAGWVTAGSRLSRGRASARPIRAAGTPSTATESTARSRWKSRLKRERPCVARAVIVALVPLRKRFAAGS